MSEEVAHVSARVSAILGYVPRVENTTIANLLDQGLSIGARIVRLRENRDPWRGVEFDVDLLV